MTFDVMHLYRKDIKIFTSMSSALNMGNWHLGSLSECEIICSRVSELKLHFPWTCTFTFVFLKRLSLVLSIIMRGERGCEQLSKEQELDNMFTLLSNVFFLMGTTRPTFCSSKFHTAGRPSCLFE